MKVVAVSGGYDPVHIGHVKLFQEAKKLGDKLVVILNNDIWLKKKKGYVFMPQEQRLEIIKEFACVDEVILTGHEEDEMDMSVCFELQALRPDIFANGGDRKEGNVPEDFTCKNLGIKLAYNVGGDKIESSSWLIENALKNVPKTKKK